MYLSLSPFLLPTGASWDRLLNPLSAHASLSQGLLLGDPVLTSSFLWRREALLPSVTPDISCPSYTSSLFLQPYRVFMQALAHGNDKKASGA